MFLMKCEDDSSYCIVDNHDVICDETVVEIGESVPFYWNKKRFTGEIIISENVTVLNTEICKLKKIDTCKKKSVTLHNKNETASGKRKVIVNRAFEQPSTSTKKIKLQSNVTTNKKEILRKNKKSETVKSDTSTMDSSDISQYNEDNRENFQDLNTSFSEKDVKNSTENNEIFNSSPTKEELKEIAEKYYKLLDKQSTTNLNTSIIDTIDHQSTNQVLQNIKQENKQNKGSDPMIELYDDTNLDNDQLLGCEYTGDEMIHLRHGIFCRKRIYNYAIESSHRASHIARKLLEGVFKEEALVKCTFTGQSPRSLGKERQREKMSCLHDIAKNAIIDFSMEMAVKKGWEYQNKEKIKQAMSQRLGELKRDKRHIDQKEV